MVYKKVQLENHVFRMGWLFVWGLDQSAVSYKILNTDFGYISDI